MPRLIEIALFLTPFAAFLLWRLIAPAPALPLWLVGGLTGLVMIMIAGLLWTWHQEAGDARQTYVPATMQDGRIVPGGPGRPP